MRIDGERLRLTPRPPGRTGILHADQAKRNPGIVGVAVCASGVNRDPRRGTTRRTA